MREVRNISFDPSQPIRVVGSLAAAGFDEYFTSAQILASSSSSPLMNRTYGNVSLTIYYAGNNVLYVDNNGSASLAIIGYVQSSGSTLEFELADGIHAIVGDYYVGRTDYNSTGEWRCDGGEIILIDNRNGYSFRSSTCVVRATSTSLGFYFKQSGGSSSWMVPITIHIIM